MAGLTIRNLVKRYGDVVALDGLDLADFERSFRDDAGDGGEAVEAEVLEGFQIGLETRSARAIGAGDGHHGDYLCISRCRCFLHLWERLSIFWVCPKTSRNSKACESKSMM